MSIKSEGLETFGSNKPKGLEVYQNNLFVAQARIEKMTYFLNNQLFNVLFSELMCHFLVFFSLFHLNNVTCLSYFEYNKSLRFLSITGQLHFHAHFRYGTA